MSSKGVMGKRTCQVSHFQEVEMIAINPPPEVRQERRLGGSGSLLPEPATNLCYVPTVRPGQAPIQRRLPTDVVVGKASDPFAPKLTANSMQKLHELIEAQKNFLKYYELKEEQKLKDRHSDDIVTTEVRQSRSDNSTPFTGCDEERMLQRRRNGWMKDDREKLRTDAQRWPDELQGKDEQPMSSPPDSDKENSSGRRWAKKVRKVAKLPRIDLSSEVGQEEPGLKRKSEERRSPVPEKLTKVDREVLTDGREIVNEGTQTEPGGVSQGASEPVCLSSRVTLVSRKRVVALLTQAPSAHAPTSAPSAHAPTSAPSAHAPISAPTAAATHAAPTAPATFAESLDLDRKKHGETAESRTTSDRQQEADKRPWRTNMKAVSKGGQQQQPTEETAGKLAQEKSTKPWRVNMRPPEAKVEVRAESVPKKVEAERPWRANMKRPEAKPPEVTVTTTRKRHFDRDEVKKYMLEKKKKEKAKLEEEERQERVRQETIRRRLVDLERLQAKIVAADLVEAHKLSPLQERERQESLRHTLVELTRQMKERWQLKQQQPPPLDDSQPDQMGSEKYEHQLRFIELEERVTCAVAAEQEQAGSSYNNRFDGDDISEASDATEIKSLPESSSPSRKSASIERREHDEDQDISQGHQQRLDRNADDRSQGHQQRLARDADDRSQGHQQRLVRVAEDRSQGHQQKPMGSDRRSSKDSDKSNEEPGRMTSGLDERSNRDNRKSEGTANRSTRDDRRLNRDEDRVKDIESDRDISAKSEDRMLRAEKTAATHRLRHDEVVEEGEKRSMIKSTDGVVSQEDRRDLAEENRLEPRSDGGGSAKDGRPDVPVVLEDKYSSSSTSGASNNRRNGLSVEIQSRGVSSNMPSAGAMTVSAPSAMVPVLTYGLLSSGTPAFGAPSSGAPVSSALSHGGALVFGTSSSGAPRIEASFGVPEGKVRVTQTPIFGAPASEESNFGNLQNGVEAPRRLDLQMSRGPVNLNNKKSRGKEAKRTYVEDSGSEGRVGAGALGQDTTPGSPAVLTDQIPERDLSDRADERVLSQDRSVLGLSQAVPPSELACPQSRRASSELELTWAEQFAGDQVDHVTDHVTQHVADQVTDQMTARSGGIDPEELIPRFPSALTGGNRQREKPYLSPVVLPVPMLPKPVPRGGQQVSSSRETLPSEDEKPPHWIEVTKDSSGPETEQVAPLHRISDHFFLPATSLAHASNVIHSTQLAEGSPLLNNLPVLPTPSRPSTANYILLPPLSRPDPNNVINTIVRKLEGGREAMRKSASQEPEEARMNISEGLLSSSSSSDKSSNSEKRLRKESLKKNQKILQNARELKNKTSILELEDSDSESTMKDIEDNLGGADNAPGSTSERAAGSRHRMRKSSQQRAGTTRETSAGRDVTDSVGMPPSVAVAAERSVVPAAMHFRFMAELQQYEAVSATERLLAELEQIKRSAFDSQRSLTEVQAEMRVQRHREEQQRAQREIEAIYASKLEQLLNNQTEATKATWEAARQLAAVAAGAPTATAAPSATAAASDPTLVAVIQGLQQDIRGLRPPRKNEAQSSEEDSTRLSRGRRSKRAEESSATSRLTPTLTRKTSRTSIQTTMTPSVTIEDNIPSQSIESEINTARSSERATFDEATNTVQEAGSSGRSLAASSVRLLAAVTSSGPPTSILELIGEHQRQEASIQQTISEALASMSENDGQKSRSNITAEVEEMLSTDYSSQFDDDDPTLREERSSRATAAEQLRSSCQQLRRRKQKPARSPRQHRAIETAARNSESSNSNNSSVATSQSGEEEGGSTAVASKLSGMRSREHIDSLIAPSPDSDDASFELFVLEMRRLQLNEAALRDRDKEALLKQQERALVRTARQELAAVEQQLTGSSQQEEDERALRRKQRSILMRLKERQKEIGRLREALRIADRERRSLNDQLQILLAKVQRFRGLRAAAEQPHPLDSTLEDSDPALDAAAQYQLRLRRRINLISGRPGSDKHPAEGSEHEEADLARSIATTIARPPSPLLPISPQRLSSLRIRHASGGESEAETSVAAAVRDHFGDTTTTASDQSDVEARIGALSEQLRSRIRTAARLKKEQERRWRGTPAAAAAQDREQLRGQEAALLKQIEVYDQLISQGLAEESMLQPATAAAVAFSKPKIKSPKSSLATGASSSSLAIRRERLTTESTASRSSAATSPDQSVSLSQAIGEESNSVSSRKSGSNISTSTILASPVKEADIVPSSNHESEDASLQQISEAIEESLATLSQEEHQASNKIEAQAEGEESEKWSANEVSQVSSVRTETDVSAATVKTSSQRDSSPSSASRSTNVSSGETKELSSEASASRENEKQPEVPPEVDKDISGANSAPVIEKQEEITNLVRQEKNEIMKELTFLEPARSEIEQRFDKDDEVRADVEKLSAASSISKEAELVNEIEPRIISASAEDLVPLIGPGDERTATALQAKPGITNKIVLSDAALAHRPLSDALVDKITDSLWQTLLADICTAQTRQQLFLSNRLSLVEKQQPHQVQGRGSRAGEPQQRQREGQQGEDNQQPQHQRLTRAVQRAVAVAKSPTRAKPQDLMLTTFDISASDSSSSSTSADDLSPIASQSLNVIASSTEPCETVPEDEDENATMAISGLKQHHHQNADDFYEEDDFGLSAIRQEAELLRLQQLRVEAEIARIQREEAAVAAAENIVTTAVRQIPDKPPPPYVPPPVQVKSPSPVAPKPTRPPPAKAFLPSSPEQVGDYIEQAAERLFRIKEQTGSWGAVTGREKELQLLVEVELAGRGSNLREEERTALSQYLDLLTDLVIYRTQEIYQVENLRQPPPWMPPRPLARLKYQLPRTPASLAQLLKKQVLADLKLAPRVEREGLFVRWAGKKRDIVDEVLVRELQEEENQWQDFAEDEVLVKDQLAEGLLQSLLADTVESFTKLYKKKANSENLDI